MDEAFVCSAFWLEKLLQIAHRRDAIGVYEYSSASRYGSGIHNLSDI